MEFNIGKRTWKLLFVKELPPDPNLPLERYGDTTWADQLIRIQKDLRPEETLETIIHELLHARFPKLKEKTVTDAGGLIAAILWRLGYRSPRL